MKKFIYLLITMAFILGCSVDQIENNFENSLDAKGKVNANSTEKITFSIPTLSLEESTEASLKVRITAGEYGATGGLTVRWMTQKDFEDMGWTNDQAGHVNLNANPQHPERNLEAGEFFIFNLEDYIDAEDYLENETSYNRPLKCGLTYVFIVEANQDGQKTKSGYSDPMAFSTAPCETVCAHGLGYWKNHSNENNGNQSDWWPVKQLMLGSKSYNQDELNAILDSSNDKGNNLVIFSQHLITAKLNVANGVDDSSVAETIVKADGLIGDKVILEDSFTDREKDESGELKTLLENFNESPCSDDEE